MKRSMSWLSFAAVVAALIAGSFAVVQAEEENDSTFISLTRRPTPMSDLPTNVTIVTETEIKKSGAENLTELLDTLPGVSLSRSGALGSSAFVRLRGVPSANQVQILVDDQPLGGVSIQNINLSLIPTDNIERIEIVRGGSSVLYGANTLGGVIHIFTKKQTSDKPTFNLGFEGRSHQTKIYSADAGARNNRVDALISASKYTTDGYQNNSDAENKNIAANSGYSFSNGARLEGSYGRSELELGSPNGTPILFDQWNGALEKTANSPTQRVENIINKGRLKASCPLFNNSFVQSEFYHSAESYKLRLNPDADPLATYNNFITGNDTRFFFPHGVTTGISYERDERKSFDQVTPNFTIVGSNDITNVGIYLEQQLAFNKLSISPGVRWDHHSAFGNQLNPRLTTVYRVTDNWKWSANAARSYRAPTLVDLYIVATDPFFPAYDFFGNPNLKPEIAWTYDLGTQISCGDHLILDLTGFYSRILHRIIPVDTDGNGNDDTNQNLSAAEVSGIESTAKIMTGPVTQQVNYTFQRGVGDSATSAKFVALRYTPRHTINHQLSWKITRNTEFINTLQYVAEQFQKDGYQGVRIPPYGLWHIRLEQRVGPVKVFFAVNNMTNRLYAESVTFGNLVPQPTRTYWAGINLHFPG